MGSLEVGVIPAAQFSLKNHQNCAAGIHQKSTTFVRFA
jgi:hypothetical protein